MSQNNTSDATKKTTTRLRASIMRKRESINQKSHRGHKSSPRERNARTGERGAEQEAGQEEACPETCVVACLELRASRHWDDPKLLIIGRKTPKFGFFFPNEPSTHNQQSAGDPQMKTIYRGGSSASSSTCWKIHRLRSRIGSLTSFMAITD